MGNTATCGNAARYLLSNGAVHPRIGISSLLRTPAQLASAGDITGRKLADEMLRSSEERYRTLFESNPNPMWVFDVETLSFLAVNAAAVRHYGYSQNEFLAMTLKDIRPSEDVPALMDDLSRKNDSSNQSYHWRH